MSLLLAITGGGGSNGVGSASGTSTVNAVGSALFSGVGASAGVGVATGISNTVFNATGVSSGTGLATGVGSSLFSGVASSAGVGLASGVGSFSSGGVINAVGSSAGLASVSGVGVTAINAVFNAAGISAANGVTAAIKAAVGNAAGVGVAVGRPPVGYAQLGRLPLDPFLPHYDNESALIRRVSEVYRQIAIFYNTMTLSTAGTFAILPVNAFMPTSLYQLGLIWNEYNKNIIINYNTLSVTISTSQAMSLTGFASVDSQKAFRVNFYDQYRIIAKSFNSLAEIIDTNNGY